MIITLVGAGNAVIQSVPAIFKGDPGDGGSGGSATWETLTGKPTTFTPSTHAHAITEVTGLQAVLDDKSDILHDHSWEEVTNKPVSFNPTSHNHNIDEVTGLQTALDGKQPTTTFKTINNEAITGLGNITISSGGTSYDDTGITNRVTALENEPDVTWTTLTGKPTEFEPSEHNHVVGDVTGLQDALDGKSNTSHTHTWSQVTDKPTEFSPTTHNHTISEVTGLQTALDGKQPTTTFKTVNSQTITGTGNIVTVETFTTDSAALAFSIANPGAIAFSTEI